MPDLNWVGLLLVPWLLASCGVAHAGYDPLDVPTVKPEHRDLTTHDAKRSRDIPIRVYLPRRAESSPVIIFSHGLGGTRAGSEYLGDHWAKRGYIVVFVQHPGSDISVWKDKPLARRMTAMQEAASLENLRLRLDDVKFVLDELDSWNSDVKHDLHGRLDLLHVGMSGHSFGAVTTQFLSGEKPVVGRTFTDPRIQAAVIMSPSRPGSAIQIPLSQM